MPIINITSSIQGITTVEPYLTYNEIKRIIGIFNGNSVVTPTIINTISFFSSNLISGQSSVNSSLDVDHLYTISTTINGLSNINPDLLVGTVKLLSATVNGQSTSSGNLYNIQCLSEGNNNLKIWGDEVTAYTYGTLDYTSHVRGTFCFKGTPDNIHSPTLSLGLKKRVSLADYDELWFFVKASSLNRNINFSLYRWPYNTTAFNLDPYIEGGDLLTTWKLAKVPLSVIETNGNGWTRNQGVEHFKFGVADTSGSYNIFVDEMWAVDSSVIDGTSAPFVGEFKAYQFSNTNIGSSNEQTVKIYNIGQTTLEVCDIDITGLDSDHFIAFPPGISSAETGNYIEIPVHFIPQSSGTKTASLVVRHSDTMWSDTSVVTIYGDAFGPEIQLDTTSIDFGVVSDENYLDVIVKISNTGNQTLNIFDVSSSSTDISVVSYSGEITPDTTSDLVLRFSSISTIVTISGSSTNTFDLGVTKSFDASIFSAKSLVESDLYIDEYPFGTFRINNTSSTAFNIGITYNLSLKVTNEISGFSIVSSDITITNGLQSIRSDGNSVVTSRLSVLKTFDSLFSASSSPVITLNSVNTYDLIISGQTNIQPSLKVDRVMNLDVISSGSANIEMTPLYPDYSLNIHGASVVSFNMSEIRVDLTRKTHYPYPVVTLIRSNYPWQHNDVYSRDIREIKKRQVSTYTTEEFDQLIIDKATKTGETQHGNIALLNGVDGDLVDSGIHPNDLITNTIDFGTF